MKPTLLIGNALCVLGDVADGSAQCCVTSPPYWGLRDYGDPGQDWPAVEFTVSLGGLDVPVCVPASTAPLGLESTPIAYVGHLVAIFREVLRVLADDGTLWLNIGDTYAGGSTKTGRNDESPEALERRSAMFGSGKPKALKGQLRCAVERDHGMKPKDLVGIPWLLAYALRSDGWYLRSDIIWHKLNPMPESVTDRPTKGHEYVFLLAKSERYRCDMASIAEPAQDRETQRGKMRRTVDSGFVADGKRMRTRSGLHNQSPRTMRNARTVWPIASQPMKAAHFAVMPPELARRCIVAGARVGDTVLDPFAGACTVGTVAIEQGRAFVGVELSAEYAQIGIERMDSARSKIGDVAKTDAKQGQQIGLFTLPFEKT